MDFVNGLIGFFGDFGNWAFSQLQGVLSWAGGLIAKLASHLGFIKNLFSSLLSHLHGLWTALRHLNLSSLWRTLKSWYHRFRRWADWFNKHLLAPIRQAQAMLRHIYATIFGPVIRAIDAIRVITQTIAIFDKHLAAQLDAFFFNLEAKVLAPFQYMTSRINALSSFALAIITATGRIDGTIFIDTLRYHTGDVRRGVMGFPWVSFDPAPPPPPDPAIQGRADLHDAMVNGTGPIQDAVDSNRLYLKGLLAEIS